MIRKPVVAGQFYAGSQVSLRKEVTRFTVDKKDVIDVLGVVSPHAGYIYSGPVAGEVLSSVKPKPKYIILGPNHTGYGKPFGLDSREAWKTPLGEVMIDDDLRTAILGSSHYVTEDTLCHDFEHSIEVQLPFLQHLHNDFTFVPIVVASADRKIYRAIGSDIARVVRGIRKDVTIIASSDMTHYESHDSAKTKDMMAIEKILALDVDGFLDTVEKYDISMCGFAPTAIMLQASIELGATRAVLVKYNTSGDTSGDFAAVVGYAGIIVY